MDVTIFSQEGFGEVRTLTINEKPYFVGSDVAKCLGYNEPHKACLLYTSPSPRDS